MGNARSSGCSCLWGASKADVDRAWRWFEARNAPGAPVQTGGGSTFGIPRAQVRTCLTGAAARPPSRPTSQQRAPEHAPYCPPDAPEAPAPQDDQRQEQLQQQGQAGTGTATGTTDGPPPEPSLERREGCQWPLCPVREDKQDAVDGFQLVCALALFSCMDRHDKLRLVFDLVDFERRGSLGFDELFLLLDCCCAAARSFSAFEPPGTEELEGVVECLFEQGPQVARDTGRLSRRAFVDTKVVRVQRCLLLFESRLDQFGALVPARPDPGLLLDTVRDYDLNVGADDLRRLDDCKASEAEGPVPLHLGQPTHLRGCTAAFYMGDGALVHVASSVVAVHEAEAVGSKPPRLQWLHRSPVQRTAYSWELGAFATACREEVLVWRCSAGGRDTAVVAAIPLDGRGCAALAWSPHGLLACAFDWGGVHVYRVRDNEVSRECVLSIPRNRVRALCFGADPTQLVACGASGFVEFLDTAKLQRRRGHASLALVKQAAFEALCFDSAAFHPQTQLLVLGADDGCLYVWQGVKLMRIERAHDAAQPITALQPCARGFCSGGSVDGVIHQWSMTAGKAASFATMTPDLVDTLGCGLQSVCWSKDGSRIAAVTKAQELFLLHGINGANVSSPFDDHLAFSVGQNEARAWYLDAPRALMLTVGSDETLKLWDWKTMETLSTSFLPGPGRLIRTGALAPDDGSGTKSHNKFRVAVCLDGGCVVLERDQDERTWTQIFSFSEAGFSPQCLALSPCSRFLAAGNRIFDLQLAELHGMCPEITRDPDNYFFSKAPSRGHWRLHVDDQVFDLVVKGFLRSKAVKEVKPSTLEREARKAGKAAQPPTDAETAPDAADGEPDLDLVGRLVQSGQPPGEGASGAREGLPPSPVLFDPRRGSVLRLAEHQQVRQLQCPAQPQSPPQHVLECLASSKLQRVQGCKGPWGDCVVSNEAAGVLAYAAFDVVVLRMRSVSFLHMQGQVVSLDLACLAEDSGPGAGMRLRLIASDLAYVCIWELEPTTGRVSLIACHAPDLPIEQVSFCAGAQAAILLESSAFHELDLSTDRLVAHVPVRLANVTGKGRYKAPGRPRSLMQLPGSAGRLRSQERVLAEIVVGSASVVVHRFSGRKVSSSEVIEHSCALTCGDAGWLGDDRGSLWAIRKEDQAPAEAPFGLVLLTRDAHDSGPVVALRDRVSASEIGILRVWSPAGEVLRTVDCAVSFAQPSPAAEETSERDKVEIWGVSEYGAVLDGHKVVNLTALAAKTAKTAKAAATGGAVVTSSHREVGAVAFAANVPGTEAKGLFASTGKRDGTVCLWDSKLELLSQADVGAGAGEAHCTCVQFSHMGRLLAVGRSDGMVELLRVPSLERDRVIDCLAEGPAGGLAIACLGWAPDQSAAQKSEKNRLAVARSDGALFFFDGAQKPIRQPLTGLTKLSERPRRICFAEDCEVVRCEDETGNTVYADSVSANHIPEDFLDKKWVLPPPTDSAAIYRSVLKYSSGTQPPQLLSAASREADLREGPKWAVGPGMRALGVNGKCERAFNASGELVYVAANAVVAYEPALKQQRLLLHEACEIETIAFDEAAGTERSVAAVFGGSEVAVFDITNSELVARWHFAPEPRRGPQATGTSTAAEAEAEPREADPAEEGDGPQDAPRAVVKRMTMHSWRGPCGRLAVAVAILHGDEAGANQLSLFESQSRVQHRLVLDGPRFSDLLFVREAESGPLRTLARPCCVAEGGGEAHFFSAATGALQEVGSLGGLGAVTCCASPGLFGDDAGRIVFVAGAGIEDAIAAHAQAVVALSLGRDFAASGRFASMDRIGEVRVWEQRSQCLMSMQMPSPSRTLALHPDGMTCCTDYHEMLRESYFEDSDKDERVLPFWGHTMPCTCYTLCEMARRTVLFTGARDCTLCKWDIEDGKRIDTVPLEDVPLSVAFCMDKLFVILDTQPNRKLVVLDTAFYDVMHESKLPSESCTTIRCGTPASPELEVLDSVSGKRHTLQADSYRLSGPLQVVVAPPSQALTVSLRANAAFISRGSQQQQQQQQQGQGQQGQQGQQQQGS